MTITTLDELFDLMKTDQTDCDWCDLPTFGERNIDGDADLTVLLAGPLWSWDDTRAIVGSCSDDIDIVDIAECAEQFRRQRQQARNA